MSFVTKAELRQYGGAVMTHWSAIILGVASLVLLVIQVASEATGWRLWPWWANLIVFALALHWGQFLAWLDMKRERDALRIYNISQDTLDKVAEYRDALVVMQNEWIKSEIELGGWIERYRVFREDIAQYLERNFSPAEARLFRTLGLYAIYNTYRIRQL